MDHQQSVKYKSTTIKTLRPAHTATSSKDRWIMAYSTGITMPGKPSNPNNKIKKKYLTGTLGINAQQKIYKIRYVIKDRMIIMAFC